jgi:hypothetical protein
MALVKTLKTFRGWIDQNKRKNVRFMGAYKQTMEKEIGPSIKEFQDRFKDKGEGQSPVFAHIMEAFSWLSRPITFMETRLRPSVGMGVFLERWMMIHAVETYLKECCQETDRHLEAVSQEIGDRTRETGDRPQESE